MVLIVGLGNPGRKFSKTRHSVGFMVVDEFAEENRFPDFKFSKKFKAEISKGFFEDNEVILAKPQTFMNESGKAVKKIIRNQKLGAKKFPHRRKFLGTSGKKYLEIRNLFVVHDDLDLPPGKIKIVKNRGAAGHKGVQSVINELGTKNFVRFRVGISSSPPRRAERGGAGKSFVLEKFTKEEKKILKEVIKKTVKAIEIALKEGIEKAMSEFN